MSTTIDNAYIKQYESQVHAAYQRMGSKLRGTVRNVNNVKGESTTFQKVGKGSAGTKTKHGLVPTMNQDHTPVECLLQDYYAGDWVDKLDLLKTNISEQEIISDAGAYALGRTTDDLIITSMASLNIGAQKIAHGGTGLTKAKIYSAFELHGNNDIPEDGQRFAIVGMKQWTDLMEIEEFKNADYVGADDLPFKSQTMTKNWLGTYWMAHSGLPVASGIRKNYWYHKTAVGHASGADVTTDITWHGDRAAHFVNNMMSQGSVLIDGYGLVEISCQE